MRDAAGAGGVVGDGRWGWSGSAVGRGERAGLHPRLAASTRLRQTRPGGTEVGVTAGKGRDGGRGVRHGGCDRGVRTQAAAAVSWWAGASGLLGHLRFQGLAQGVPPPGQLVADSGQVAPEGVKGGLLIL